MSGPRTFGQWNGLATAGELVFGSLADARAGTYLGERVSKWLHSHGVHGLAPDVEKELGWCESGSEAILASHFAPQFSDIVRVADRVLGWNGESLEIQVQIPETHYRADFRWTSANGTALVEVFGAAAHSARRVRDVARHALLVELGYTIHYVPADMLLRNPASAWAALRRRQRNIANSAQPRAGVTRAP